MSSNQEKYLREAEVTISEVLKTEGLHVVFSDYSALHIIARSTGLCNWGILDDRYLPSGFGVAFVQGSPYKKFIDEV